ncbi:MAG: 4,5-DOPA dioxygenase extradiol [Candidatus Odinarchaeota archaeon]
MKETKNKTEKMPILFIGHGSPMNIISDNEFTRSLKMLGKILPTPKAILVISAHWLTSGTKVLCNEQPRTIYDFYGFPEQLYKLLYPSFGSPELAGRISRKLTAYNVKCDYMWGYDHASWAILKHIYPKANIPMIELSLDYVFNDWRIKPIEYHYRMAQNLAFLRREGVLIIGSGNIVHNLRMIDYDVNAPIMEWAKELDAVVKENIIDKNYDVLVHIEKLGANARIGIPTWDHYLPMIYIIGLQEAEDSVKFVHEGFQHGSISMRCFQIGIQ